MSKVWIAKIKDGRMGLSDYNKADLNEYLKANGGKDLRIEPAKNPVSDNLRGYYFAAVLPFFQKLEGWDKLNEDQIHVALKKEFNGTTFVNPVSKRMETHGKTIMGSESNSVKAMDYLERIRLYAAENYGKELPSPEEYKKRRDSAKLINEQ